MNEQVTDVVEDVERRDYWLDEFEVPPGLMPDPQFNELKAQIQVHRVRPKYANDKSPSEPPPAVVLIHGRTVPGPVAFDLRDPPGVTAPGGGPLKLSVQEALAWAGIDTFAPSLLGYGKSTRFDKGLDDPGNASLPSDRTLIPGINPLDQQGRMLLVNPLAGQKRAHSSTYRFARTDVWVRDIDQVINFAIDQTNDAYSDSPGPPSARSPWWATRLAGSTSGGCCTRATRSAGTSLNPAAGSSRR